MSVTSNTMALVVALLLTGFVLSSSSSSFRTPMEDDDVVEPLPLLDRILRGRRLKAEPSWFSRMQVEDTSGILKRCYKRTTVPVDGSSCSINSKMCYFGMQRCTTVGDHPTVQCTCVGAIWSCQSLTCPSAGQLEPPTGTPVELPTETPVEPPTKSPTESPIEPPTCAGKIAADRDTVRCPPVSPLDDQNPDNSCSVEGASCSYGSEECCGECFASSTCDCFDGEWACYLTDACLFSSCGGGAHQSPSTSPSLAPKSMTPAPTGCPQDRFALCSPGSRCKEVVSVVTKENDICTTTDVCTCQNSGFYQCVPSEDCVSQPDPSPTPCPIEKTESCTTEGQQCVFTSEEEFPKANFAVERCTSTESCTCVQGAFECGPVVNSCVEIDRDLHALNGGALR